MKKNTWLLLALLLAVPARADDTGIVRLRGMAQQKASGQLSVDTRYRIRLPEQLAEALVAGVPLYFVLDYRITAPLIAGYKFRFSRLFSDTDDQITYRLSYHPITRRYRVSMGTFSTEYNSLDTALRAIGSTVDWLIPSDASDGTSGLKADVRLSLSTARLPKPFQINAITSKNWQLDSDWQPLQEP